jgi:O-antigen/teichoic acid export membrane protein
MSKSFVKDTTIYGLTDIVFKFIAFFTFPIFINIFTVTDYGILNLALTVSSFASSIFTCGLNNAVQRYYLDADNQKIIKSSLVSTGLLTLIIFVTFGAFLLSGLAYILQDKLLDKFQLEWKYILFALLGTVFLQIFVFGLDILRLYFTPWKFALLSLLHNSFSVIMTLTLVWGFNLGITGFLIGTLIANALISFPCLWMIREDLSWKIDYQLGKKLIKFGYSFIFFGVGLWFLGSMDRWMLGDLSSLEEIGLYSVAFKLVTIITILLTAVGQAWNPHALRLFSNDINYKLTYSKMLTLIFFFFTICCSSISLFSIEFLMFLAPPSYWKGAQSLVFLSMSYAFYSMAPITALSFSLKDKTFHLTIASWISAGVNFFFNYILIPKYGAVGASIATFISYIAMTAYYLIFSQKIHPLSLEYKKLGVCLFIIASTICISFFLLTLEWSVSVFLFKIMVLGFFVYLGFVYKIFAFENVKALLVNFINRFRDLSLFSSQKEIP